MLPRTRPIRYALVDLTAKQITHAGEARSVRQTPRRAHRRIQVAWRARGARAALAPVRLPLAASVAIGRIDNVQPAPRGRRAQPHPLQGRREAGRCLLAILRICAGRAAAAAAARPRRRPSLPGSLRLVAAAAVGSRGARAAALARRRARCAWAACGARPGRGRNRSAGTGVGAGQPRRPCALEAPCRWAAMRRRGAGRPTASCRAAGRCAALAARRAQAQRAQRARVRRGKAVKRVLGVRHRPCGICCRAWRRPCLACAPLLCAQGALLALLLGGRRRRRRGLHAPGKLVRIPGQQRLRSTCTVSIRGAAIWQLDVDRDAEEEGCRHHVHFPCRMYISPYQRCLHQTCVTRGLVGCGSNTAKHSKVAHATMRSAARQTARKSEFYALPKMLNCGVRVAAGAMPLHALSLQLGFLPRLHVIGVGGETGELAHDGVHRAGNAAAGRQVARAQQRHAAALARAGARS